MAHKEQWVFCGKVKGLHPSYFKDKKVLDIGSFDVNGNEEFLFNYKPERFHVNVDLPANQDVAPADALDPYANLPEEIE